MTGNRSQVPFHFFLRALQKRYGFSIDTAITVYYRDTYGNVYLQDYKKYINQVQCDIYYLSLTPERLGQSFTLPNPKVN